MNLPIETLNVWADHALGFAWPMLWQSSLLIGVLFALDWLLRRKVRAAVRYALWLVVLAKLVVPPSLAFPTSAGWWLRPAKAAPAVPRLTSVTVTYDAIPQPAPPITAPPVVVAPPQPRLSPTAWLLLATVGVGLGLLAWMLARWRQVARDVRQASPAPACLRELLPASRRRMTLRLTDLPQSPAVCGLFRPVILLPRSLADQLPPAQLRAVLLHELLHLRRGDVWVNCAQALLQIVYWWHPLLWLANARIRRVREEAVDDAVMLALNEEAETYAPTLLEVAKLALHRPLASLGLVGILESRSSLRQRIERLMDFRPPRRAGLTLASALAVLGFAALAVPMGEAPPPTANPGLAASLLETNKPATTPPLAVGSPATNQPLFVRTFKVSEQTLIEGLHLPMGPTATNNLESVLPALGRLFAKAGADLDPQRNPGKAFFYGDRKGMLVVRATQQDLDIIERELAALTAQNGGALAIAKTPQTAGTNAPAPSPLSPILTNAPALLEELVRISGLVKDGKLLFEMGKLNEAEAKLREALRADPQNQAAAYHLNLVAEARLSPNTDKRHLLPFPMGEPRTNAIRVSSDRQSIINALNDIRFDRVAFERLPLSEVIQYLSDESRKRDPRKLGINFVLNSAETASSPWLAAIDPATGSPTAATAPAAGSLRDVTITVNPPITNVRLADMLDVIVKVASQPIKYSIESYCVVFSARSNPEASPLYVRTFKVDQNALLEALHIPRGTHRIDVNEAVTAGLRSYLGPAGVDLDPAKHPGKNLFYNDRQGMLLVRASLQDLDIIATVISVIGSTPPQVNIKCKFVEVTQDDIKPMGFDWYLGNVLVTPGAPGASNGVRTVAGPTGFFPGGTIMPGSNFQVAAVGLRPTSSNAPTLSGILSEPQYRVVLRALQQRNAAKVIAEPQITTLSGRQAQCKVAEVKTLMTGIKEQALTPPGIQGADATDASVLATEQLELGPTLDIIPCVLSDGYTINVTVVATLLEFLGYDDASTNHQTAYVNGKARQISAPRPKFRNCQIVSTLNVQDGQTVVLGGMVSEHVLTMKDKVPVLGSLPLLGRLFRSESKTTQKRNLLVFITPTIIDPAGNRVHEPDKPPASRKEAALLEKDLRPGTR